MPGQTIVIAVRFLCRQLLSSSSALQIRAGILIFITGLAASGYSYAQSSPSQPGPVSNEISDWSNLFNRRVTKVNVVVEDFTTADTALMGTYLDVSSSQDFSPVRIHDSIVRLFNSGLVSSARATAEPSGSDGVTVKFIVKLQTRINAILFEGNPIYSTEALRARVSNLEPGQKLTPSAVSHGLSELAAFYATRGYYQAAITTEIRLDPAGTRASLVYTIKPGERARVTDLKIDITGTKIDLTTIKHSINIGESFSQAVVREEIDNIKQAYLKQNYLAVQLSSTTNINSSNNTVALALLVDSGPLFQVDVKGLAIDEKVKRTIFPFYSRGGIDEFSLEEGRIQLLDYAQRSGYFFAEVTSPLMPALSGSSVKLEYTVETGQRYRLTNIHILGVQAVRVQDLLPQLKSKPAATITLFGVGRGITSNELLRQDANYIQKKVRDEGYRQARVDVLRGVSISGDHLIITFQVREGPRTRITDIGLRGNTIFPLEELRSSLLLKMEDPLVTPDVTMNADRILQVYSDKGFADAQVIPEVIEMGNEDNHDMVRLVFRIIENNRIKIGEIITRGTVLSNSSRIAQDFFSFKEGEWLNNDKLQETERVLYDTNAFNSVNIQTEPAGRIVNGTEVRNVSVDIDEAKRYLLTYGFGYQYTTPKTVTDSSGKEVKKERPTVPHLQWLQGVRGLIQLTNTNMIGRLYSGSVQFHIAQDELVGQISVQNPRPFGSKWPVAVSIFAQRIAEEDFNVDRYTGLIQAERRLSRNSILYLTYNFEAIHLYNLQVTLSPQDRALTPIRLGRVGSNFLYDTRDSAFEASRGSFTTSSVSLATRWLGGDVSLIKSISEHNRYFKVPKLRDTVFSISGRLGLSAPIGSNTAGEPKLIPLSERFFAGGPRDLRGFGYEDAIPYNNLKPAQSTLGGNGLVIINAELRFPIWSAFGGALFSDTGNVFSRVRDISPSGLTQTLGFGLRLRSPIGPLRFDMGFLVGNRPLGAPSSRFHISFGQTF